MTEKLTATFIGPGPEWKGETRFYQFSRKINGNYYIIISAIESAFNNGRPETYIFSCDSKYDHDKALEDFLEYYQDEEQ